MPVFLLPLHLNLHILNKKSNFSSFPRLTLLVPYHECTSDSYCYLAVTTTTIATTITHASTFFRNSRYSFNNH